MSELNSACPFCGGKADSWGDTVTLSDGFCYGYNCRVCALFWIARKDGKPYGIKSLRWKPPFAKVVEDGLLPIWEISGISDQQG